MKIKILSLILVIVFLLSFSAEGEQEKQKIEILKTSKTIKIDGNFEEYLNLKPSIKMDNDSFEKLGYNLWEGPEDLSADIYLLWDDENLYVTARVFDDVPFVNNNEGSDIWNGDCLEVTLGTDEKADPERVYCVKGDYQIGLSPGNNKDIKPSDWIWRKDDYMGGIEVASRKVERGYLIESKIPFKVLDGFKPQVGRAIGFDIAVDDADKDARELQFVWIGTKNFYMDPSEWGIAVLADKKITLLPPMCVLLIFLVLGIIFIIIIGSLIIRRYRKA
ncbi:MAG: sugar-binding protein [Candidatus Omnitrophota bacterium]